MKRYPKEIRNFIEENVHGTTTKDLALLVNNKFGTNFTEAKIKAYKNNHKLKSGTLVGITAGLPTDLYPEDVKNFIEEHHGGVGPKDMAELLNKKFGTRYTKQQMKAYYCNNKINSGLDGRFPKGHAPANKGRKGVDGWQPTQFKKGCKPHNRKPVGSERINGDDYVDVKIAEPDKWKGKHILLWEIANGPVPNGQAIIFGDGNNRNFDIGNLLLVSRKQLLTLNRNGLIKNDVELTKTGIVIADIYSKISERKKKSRVR